jgi:hypothetical protein
MWNISSVLRSVGLLFGGIWIIFGGATPADAIACLDVLGPGGTYRLEADLDCSQILSSFPALRVRDGARLDLNGYTVRCHPFVVGCITLMGEGAQLLNGTVAGGEHYNVTVSGTGGHTVSNIVIPIQENTVSVNSSNNLLVKITARSSGGPAFEIHGSGNRLSDNVVVCTSQESLLGCVHVTGSGNHLLKNIVSFNGAPASSASPKGFQILGNDNVLKRNVALGGHISTGVVTGIRVAGTGNVIRNNVAFGNDLDLQDSHGDCANNTWVHNTFQTSDPACIE